MHKILLGLKSLTLAVAVALFPWQASSADSLREMLRGYSNYDAGSAAFTSHQQATLNNLINTESRIRADINSGLRSGNMSPSAAANMLRELDQIAAVRLSFSAGNLTFHEAQTLVSRLGALELRVSSDIASGATVPIGNTGNFNNRIAMLETRITTELRAGRINRGQAARLRGELADIEHELDDMRATGGLSSRERERLTDDLDGLSTRLDRLASNPDSGLSLTNLQAKAGQLRIKLQNAFDHNDIAPYRARALRAELASVTRQIARLRNNPQSTRGSLRPLNQRLISLDRRITHEIRIAAQNDDDDRWY